jgi:hypothetical protein
VAISPESMITRAHYRCISSTAARPGLQVASSSRNESHRFRSRLRCLWFGQVVGPPLMRWLIGSTGAPPVRSPRTQNWHVIARTAPPPPSCLASYAFVVPSTKAYPATHKWAKLNFHRWAKLNYRNQFFVASTFFMCCLSHNRALDSSNKSHGCTVTQGNSTGCLRGVFR